MAVYSIYIAKNIINEKCYVGQTKKKVKKRIKEHSYTKESLLGRAIRKYGLLLFNVYEFNGIPLQLLDYCEQEMIKRINSAVPNGYNLHLGGQKNRLVSAETKKKISEGKKGQPSPNKGKKLTEEQKKKMSIALTGHKWTDAQKENLSKIRKAHPEKYAHMTGKKFDQKTKDKMSESAKKVIHTDEWNKKVSEAQKGKIISMEQRLKISNTLKGISQTEERKKEQSIRMKQWWADRKAGGY